jgi:hypothetical protein
VRSYWRDFGWLRFCLLSILRFCSGFRAIVVVVPEDSRARLPRLGVTSSIIRTVVCDNYRDDYLGQQVTKLYADTVTDAAYVCHVDSDCVFDRKVDVRGLIPDGRPQILVRPRPLPARRDPWLESTEEFLQLPVLHDYMCRPPFVFPRGPRHRPAPRPPGSGLLRVPCRAFVPSSPEHDCADQPAPASKLGISACTLS